MTFFRKENLSGFIWGCILLEWLSWGFDQYLFMVVFALLASVAIAIKMVKGQ